MNQQHICDFIIYHKIKEKSNGRPIVLHSKVMEEIRRTFPCIPHFTHYIILKGLIEEGLLRKIDRTKYELIIKNIKARYSNNLSYPFNI